MLQGYTLDMVPAPICLPGEYRELLQENTRIDRSLGYLGIGDHISRKPDGALAYRHASALVLPVLRIHHSRLRSGYGNLNPHGGGHEDMLWMRLGQHQWALGKRLRNRWELRCNRAYFLLLLPGAPPVSLRLLVEYYMQEYTPSESQYSEEKSQKAHLDRKTIMNAYLEICRTPELVW